MMIDIDYFKQYNDNYGHLKGDNIIRSISNLLKTNCRESDILIRYGGEEFCVILPNTTLEDSKKVVHKILEKVNDLSIEHKYSKISTKLTLSIGISSSDTSNFNNDLLKLIDLTDKELYLAKSKGRNQYSWS